MSTNYNLRCGACKEQGGDFTRQAWGWGNANVIENTIFLMAHAECWNTYQGDDDEILSIVTEHDRLYNDDEEILNWINNLQNLESRASSAFPRDNMWNELKNGVDVRIWWQQEKDSMAERKLGLEERIAEIKAVRQKKIDLRDYLIAQQYNDVKQKADACIAGGGHYFTQYSPLDGLCATCGATKNGAMIE